LLLCAADCAIFLLSVAVAEGVFLYRTESRNALLAVITFAVLLCFRPRRRRAEGKELNSRTDIWEPAFRLAFRIARREFARPEWETLQGRRRLKITVGYTKSTTPEGGFP
jgi:hypothetical protein